MPCYDPRNNPQLIHSEIEKLEAMLCALINEINTLENSQEIIKRASNNGSVDINSFFQNHQEKDMNKLQRQVVDKLSLHEIRLLRKLLSKYESSA